MNKDFNATLGAISKSVSQNDMDLINQYSQKVLSRDDVFIFSVVLCDNEIDRDFERFTVDSLEILAKMFVGKTAIKNHSMNCEDQNARTFKTEVVTDNEKTNSLGEPYVYLKGYCYMPKISKNDSLIAEIEAGIKKEVSIGCAVEKSICSICNSNSRTEPCTHKRGKKYKGKLCYFELVNPTDAYEWSFVAVPAQKNAGVTKSFLENEVRNIDNLFKSLNEADSDVVLSKDEAKKIVSYLNQLEIKSKDAEEYRNSLEENTVKLFAFTMPELSNDYTRNICKSLDTQDLKELCKAMKLKQPVSINMTPQLMNNKKTTINNNSEFRF